MSFVPFMIFLSKATAHFVPKWNDLCTVKVYMALHILLSYFIGLLELNFCELSVDGKAILLIK